MRWRRALVGAGIGVLGAGVALAVTEVTSTLVASTRPSPIDSVARILVDHLAGPLEQQAVRWFGTRDKQALVAGIVVVALAAGAALGAARARPRVWWGVHVAAALVGAGAAWRDPSASRDAALAGVIAGVAAAAAVRAVTRRTTPARQTRPSRAARRRLLVGGGATALVAVVGWSAARHWRFTAVRRATGGARRLPAPARRVAPPAAAPFPLDGLPAYETATADLFRVDTAIYPPRVDLATWRLSITGMVARPRAYTHDELLALPMAEAMVTLACVSNDVGGHLVANARWRGVPLAALLDDAGVDPEATQLVGEATDGFTVNIATRDVLDGRTALVAVAVNDDWLPVEHGFPARLVVAGFYGYASATKWLTELRLTRRDDEDSYWVALDWAKDGPVRLQSRVDVPAAGAQLPVGPVRLSGVAWAPSIGISAVEVRVDDGPWARAELAPVVSADTWVPWSLVWTGGTAGDHVAEVRAVDAAGRMQTDVPTTPKPAGADGHHFRAFTLA